MADDDRTLSPFDDADRDAAGRAAEGDAPLGEPVEDPPLDEPASADDLLEDARESDELPGRDERLDDLDRSESQGHDPVDAELGPEGEGEVLPEDR